MKRCAMVRARSTKRERTWPCRSFRIDCLPVNVRDHEYCPVTTHFASSASLATNSERSCTAGSGFPAAAKISSISFLLAIALMAASPFVKRSPSIACGLAFFQSIVDMIYIHRMNLNSLDLNLLVALDALLLEATTRGSSTQAIILQPAASDGLQRV